MPVKLDAVIFDLDGTLIDNNAYHIEAWKVFYNKIGREFSLDEYKNKINGRINRDIFNYIFDGELSSEEIERLTNEKEQLYREYYAPYIQPVPGLLGLLQQIKDAAVPMAIATSGLPVNIAFMFEHVTIKDYFDDVIDATLVTNSKPHPEIFLKAAAAVKASPLACIAFEDSVAGVRSAKTAGMKVVGLTTTHKKEDLHEADLVIKDYTEINFGSLLQLMEA
ncbi:MAG TPA: HAD family phosphatase [Chitinophagaceae bacterium]|nr:HAD family phosphatase [Chitinophagaceae bacterium]